MFQGWVSRRTENLVCSERSRGRSGCVGASPRLQEHHCLPSLRGAANTTMCRSVWRSHREGECDSVCVVGEQNSDAWVASLPHSRITHLFSVASHAQLRGVSPSFSTHNGPRQREHVGGVAIAYRYCVEAVCALPCPEVVRFFGNRLLTAVAAGFGQEWTSSLPSVTD